MGVRVKHGVDPDIGYSMDFAVFDAAVAAGATLSDLEKLDRGEFPPKFVARVVAWKNLKDAIVSHSEDAAIEAAKKKSKRR